MDICKKVYYKTFCKAGQIAQLVEQRTENPRVGGSIPSLTTNKENSSLRGVFFVGGRGRTTRHERAHR